LVNHHPFTPAGWGDRVSDSNWHLTGGQPMVSYDDKRTLCRDSYTVAKLIEQTIFAKITSDTTPDQFAAAQQSLLHLCQRFENNLDLFHYASIRGSHQCIRDVYEDARARLENLAIMHPKPQPPSVQQEITNEGIVINLEKRAQTSAEETDLGTNDSPFDNWNGR
jgi:hypothetical protein